MSKTIEVPETFEEMRAQNEAADEARIINTIRQIREDRATGKIEINMVSGGVAGVFATITKKIK